MASLDELKRTRKFARVSFSRLCGRIERLEKETPVDKASIRTIIKLLEEKDGFITELNSKIQSILLSQESFTEKEIEDEMELAEEYHERCIHFTLRYEQKFVDDSQVSFNVSESTPTSRRSLSLPKLTLNTFDGEVRSWLPFWNSFKLIHEDVGLTKEQKFQYLLQAIGPGTRAREVVDSFPLNEGNYEKAIKSLRERFGRDELLIDFYVRELLKIIISNALNPEGVKLTKLHDSIQSQIRALSTLGVTMERCAPVLYPLVESCLPSDFLRNWQRHKSSTPSYAVATHDSLKEDLANLLLFLKSEVEQEELVAMAAEGFGLTEHFSGKQRRRETKAQVPTASGLLNSNPKFSEKCIFCDSPSHKAVDCKKAKSLTMEERRKIAADKRACFRCLKPGHQAVRCFAKYRCVLCGNRHLPIMCPEVTRVKLYETSEGTESKGSPHERQTEASLLSSSSSPEVYLQTVRVTLRGVNKDKEVRALFDSGSQRSYILNSTAKELGYRLLRTQQVAHALFGGRTTETQCHGIFEIRLRSMSGSYACKFEALGQGVICGTIDTASLDRPRAEELKGHGISINDNIEGPIEVLLGADVMAKLYTQDRYELGGGLTAIRTLLGWTLMGKNMNQPKRTSSMAAVTLLNKDWSIQNLWQLEAIGIVDPGLKKTMEEAHEEVKAFFKETISSNHEGRYVVNMPWKEGHPPLSDNLAIAKRRLENTIKKLKVNRKYDSYSEILREWVAADIIEVVGSPERTSPVHYLPHRAVIKESSATTKIRPVFDASAHEKGEPSLNDCLHPGPNLIELIPSLLLRFRLEKIGVVADIAKAFLQIELHESNRDFLRFLWQDEDGREIVYRHKRVVFGVCCSPYLLGMTINYHLEKVAAQEPCLYSSSTLNRLQSSFYVDNCVTSVKDAAELSIFIREATSVMAEGKFDLRGWEHNLISVQETPTSVLGVSWDKSLDTLTLSDSCWQDSKHDKITRRIILSVVQKLFDPIGYICPAKLLPMVYLQETWSKELKWDDEVSYEISNKFKRWSKELDSLISIRIPRWLNFSKETTSSLAIHTFCDASQSAYATATFVRVQNGPFVHVHLLQAKSRVAPLKRLTIPRLELLAAVIGVRQYTNIRDSLEGLEYRSYFWSDSSTVLAWISRENEWGTFVWNRVKEIRKSTNSSDWHHVPGHLNPADLPSRGCSPKELSESKWWEGPAWLRLPEQEWPKSLPDVDEETVASERRRKTVATLSNVDCPPWYSRYFSSYSRCIRLVAWIQRFVRNCRHKDIRRSGDLSPDELESAERCLLRMVQGDFFQDPASEAKVRNLILYPDDSGLRRLKTRISNRPDSADFCCPILLPARNEIVERLIFEYHKKHCHAGAQTLLSILRERFWILGGKKFLRKVISRCIPCQRFNSQRLEEDSPALPVDRVRNASVFEVIGIDLAGPLLLKGHKKAWICLFTCAVYRAVHLELVNSLSTSSFLQALRRFVARRGRPKTIYTDRGTNFVGADNAFKKIDWNEVTKYATESRIVWKFNPPSAPWWGGFWERIIGLMKQVLRRVLGHSCLDYEEMQTVLCDCEAVLNSRPLTQQSDNPEDLIPLTPKMFLQELPDSGVPDIDKVDSTLLTRRSQLRAQLLGDLRKRFRIEYLGELKSWSKKKRRRPVSQGDLVLIGDDGVARLEWPLGLVEECLPGKDGLVRLVRVRTRRGTLMRPIQRLYLLEAADVTSEGNGQEEPPEDSGEDLGNALPKNLTITRKGRKITRPTRLDL